LESVPVCAWSKSNKCRYFDAFPGSMAELEYELDSDPWETGYRCFQNRVITNFLEIVGLIIQETDKLFLSLEDQSNITVQSNQTILKIDSWMFNKQDESSCEALDIFNISLDLISENWLDIFISHQFPFLIQRYVFSPITKRYNSGRLQTKSATFSKPET
jgi:hypothetical protein